MPLSCASNEWDGDGVAHYVPDDFTTMTAAKRKRCRSCGTLISRGADCLRFVRFRAPEHEIEERIYGEGGEIAIAPWWMCSWCGEQYLNLVAYGYCVDPEDNMHDLLDEHRELHGTEVTP